MFKLLSSFFFLSAVVAGAVTIGFNSHIRPILSDHCFTCHGFDASAREADFRLDTAAGAFADRKSGAGLISGEPEKSLIWKRITSTDPDEVMPPPDHLLTLDDQEKKLIYQWIKEGAPYQEHWTFIPVEKPKVPDLAPHPIDALVLQKLKSLDLSFSPEADKPTLVRRLSFDLRGLPATPAEVENFRTDQSPDAWEKLVERFLADPAFGERFAWPWLDAARYADTNGFQGDSERTMWPWRDWVINAINRNIPYDDFTVWQIAGDLLPDATHEQKLATGFLRNHAINGEGGSIPEENRVNYVFDMAETVGTVWMGLTFNCCRCHDHKYDPLSQKNYYSLTAFFNQTPVNGAGGDPQTKPVLAAPTESQITEERKLRSRLAKTVGDRETRAMALASERIVWEEENRKTSSQWTALATASRQASDPLLKLQVLPDQSLLTSGTNPDKATLELIAPLPNGPITAIRLDALRDPSMTKGGMSRSESGNFVLTGFEVSLIRKGEPKKQLTLTRPIATFEQGLYKISGTLDQDPTTGWAIMNANTIGRDHAAVFHFEPPLDSVAGDQVEIVLRHDSPHKKHFLGRFKVSTSKGAAPSLKGKAQDLAQLLAIPAEQRAPQQREHVIAEHLKTDSGYQKLTAEIMALEKQMTHLQKAAPKVMIMAERAEKRKTFVLAVGSYQAPGAEVTAATPGILPPLAKQESPDRLDLAQWLVSREHPLTSRVTVNRIWQNLFGLGLIKSPEDLGVQSEIPIHPNLLNWLAADFMDSGWDFKKLIKTIVTSQVYRQSSKVNSRELERDPKNRFLARAPRYRLPSWMIRDQALALSGRLIREIGGEPVKPWQPKGLWAEVTFGGGKKHYLPDTGVKLRRRSIYTFWRRISAPPMVFDNAKREGCEVGVYRTNSPLHALATLNDPLHVEGARAIAYRTHKAHPDDPTKTAFQLITSREPTPEESRIIKTIYQNSLTHYKAHPDDIDPLLSIGELPVSEEIAKVTQAALTSTILSLLNTDEALSKE